MKKIITLLSAAVILLFTHMSFACDGDRCSYQYYNYSYTNSSGCNSCDGCNSCGGSREDTYCNCVDPSCGWTWEHNCSSQRECCEAFGNVAGKFNHR